MKTRLLERWDALRTSFWFLPTVMGIGAVGLAFGAVALDQGDIGRWVSSHDLGYGGGAEGASTLLQAIASSMITIAGVVFSLTLVCLSIASTQFGPRLLRNFMADRPNQLVLGVFVATFLYCVLVLRTVRRADEQLFVPHLAVALAVVLAIASLGVLVYFIHHVAQSIQAEEMVARVGAEMLAGFDRMFPERPGSDGAGTSASPAAAIPAGPGDVVRAAVDGYLQVVDVDGLAALAKAADVRLRIGARPGDFVMRESPLVTAWPAGRVDRGVRDRLLATFAIGAARTPVQDVAFPMQQLVEMAVRALSPSTNDPFTAMACLDRLAAGLARLASRAEPPERIADADGTVRVFVTPHTFAGLLAEALDPVRHHARGTPLVLARLLATIGRIAPHAWRATDQAALRLQLEVIWREASKVEDAHDRSRLQAAHAQALSALEDDTRAPG